MPAYNHLTLSELIRAARDSECPLVAELASRLDELTPLQATADVLGNYNLDPNDPKGLDRELDKLFDAQNSLEERTVKLEAAREDLRQAEAEIDKLRAELREAERQAS